ncbi:MAG: hypothetical protein ACLGIN_17545, partial [Candidatus Sericytochromatia bacterium]
SGHVTARGKDFEGRADRARFDLEAESGEVFGFRGRWFGKAQVAGERLLVAPGRVEVENGWVTPCQHDEPDIKLTARRIRYHPDAERLNLVLDGMSLEVWGRDVLALPYYTATVGEDTEDWHGDVFPGFGFDAYRGFLTTTRLDFSLGENSRGSIPVAFSTGRGWAAGVQHYLALGPGELKNEVFYETPWAANRGGVRSYNSYRAVARGGGIVEAAADYRADVNGMPVTRAPDLSWLPPSQHLFGLVSVRHELRAGYLLEEMSGAQSMRLRWAAPMNTPIWTPVPGWQTWVSGVPFVHAYGADAFYGGGSLAWTHRQEAPGGLVLTETAELGRILGETPFFHDRAYDVERLRLQADKDWTPRIATSVMTSWSRLNQQGPFAIEDLALTGTYRWNCFQTSLVFRPLILGTEVRFQLLNF